MNIVLFDGICNLCNRTVRWLIKHDKNNTLCFAAQQSNAGERIKKQYSVSENCQSVLLIKNERVYYQSDAIIEMANHYSFFNSSQVH
jgi:predicted DCC family thiol-disulfide oxidoreductase YuxK